MGFEPTTSCLGSKHSTAELHPQRLLRLDFTSKRAERQAAGQSGEVVAVGRRSERHQAPIRVEATHIPPVGLASSRRYD